MGTNTIRRWWDKYQASSSTGADCRTFRPRLELLEDRECPAIFNIAAGDVAGLINALTVAQTNAQADTINLAANSTYTLTAVNNATNGPTGLPVINNDGPVTINGSGATITRSTAAPNFRIFNIVNGSLTMRDVTISNGNAAGAFGGAIRVSDLPAGTVENLILRNTTITGNSATNDGGGIFVGTGGKASVINSTLSGNTAGANGGGISVLDGAGVVNIVNTTLTLNTATTANGGGLNVEGGSVNVSNAILANNTAPNGPANTQNLFRLPATSGGSGTVNSRNSLYGDSPTTGANSTLNGLNFNNKFGQNPQLGTLKNNGGTTATHAITTATSPAVDAGDNSLAAAANLTTDQRGTGFNRVINGTVDIGSYEFQQVAVAIAVSSSLNPATVGQPVTFTSTVAGVAANSNVPQGTLTFFVDNVAVATVPLVNGQASFSTSSLTAGNHLIRTTYNPQVLGDYAFAAGSSPTLTQTVVNPPVINPLSPIGRRWRR